MKKIDINIYQLFLQHGSECLWTSDSRVSRPKGTTEETDKMFDLIEAVGHRFEMICTGSYSEQMVTTYLKEIEELKSMFTSDVFEILNNKYNPNED